MQKDYIYTWFRGKPDFDNEKCIGCESCQIVCPSNSIHFELNEDRTKMLKQFNYKECIFCGDCSDICPTDAIRLLSEFNLGNDINVNYELDIEYCKKCKTSFSTKRLIEYSSRFFKNDGYICLECKKNSVVESTTKYMKNKRN